MMYTLSASLHQLGGGVGVGGGCFNLSIFNELKVAKWGFVFVHEFGDGLYGKDAHIFNTPMTTQSTRGSPRSRVHGFGRGSFKDGGGTG